MIIRKDNLHLLFEGGDGYECGPVLVAVLEGEGDLAGLAEAFTEAFDLPRRADDTQELSWREVRAGHERLATAGLGVRPDAQGEGYIGSLVVAFADWLVSARGFVRVSPRTWTASTYTDSQESVLPVASDGTSFAALHEGPSALPLRGEG